MLTPRFKRSNLAKVLAEHKVLKAKNIAEIRHSQAKDQAQREWVDNRVKEINSAIRATNAKVKP